MSISKLGTCAGHRCMSPGSVTGSERLRRQLAGCLAIFLAIPFGAATAEPQQAVPAQRAAGAPSASASPQNSSGGVSSTPNAGAIQPSAVANGTNTEFSANNGQAGKSDSAPEQPQQSGTPNPMGTAAAPYEKTTGVAASRPAGAVIAPAKQKRKRSFLIRVGLILAGAAAIGTVVALSNGSPSRP